MNKNIIYIGIAALVGLLVGYFVFGINNEAIQDKHEHKAETADQMWTCSMHPQIMQTEPGDCPICGMDLIPAVSVGDGLTVDEFRLTKNAMALANIQTTVIGNHITDGNNTTTLSGKIVENEEANATQASYFEGRIERLYVNYEGQEIRKGQKLANIYAPNLIAAQQELITAASLKESQPTLYSAVRNKLKLWKLSENQINAIESSGKTQDNFPIYATVSGTVSEVMSAEGDYIKQGQPIVKVSNLTTVWAQFDGYENQISQFKKGQKISITTTAYPDKDFNAKISFIDPVLNVNTRTISIRATLNNENHIFKPGMFVTGKVFGVETDIKQLTVPSSAVLWTGERSVVYVKTNPNEPVFEMREVVLKRTNGDMYTISDGLDHGDEIVTNGTFTVDAAAQLQGKKSMMNKEGGKTMTGHEGHTGMKMELSPPVQNDFLSALASYLEMKDAFIQSNASDVATYAKKMTKELRGIKNSEIDAKKKTDIARSIEMLEGIVKKKDIDMQRAHFVVLSEKMVALISQLDMKDKIMYVQRCPMANTNKGAIWLSTEKEIRNPYFGDAMLTCGSVIDTIN